MQPMQTITMSNFVPVFSGYFDNCRAIDNQQDRDSDPRDGFVECRGNCTGTAKGVDSSQAMYRKTDDGFQYQMRFKAADGKTTDIESVEYHDGTGSAPQSLNAQHYQLYSNGLIEGHVIAPSQEAGKASWLVPSRAESEQGMAHLEAEFDKAWNVAP